VTRANVAVTTAANDATIADIDPDFAHSWYSIAPQSALPIITGPVIIDGYTQPGASANTNSVESLLGLNAVLRIELDGTSAGAGADGLKLSTGSSGSTFQGLVVNRFTGSGIEFVFLRTAT
jgi:hypothetical protein